MNFQERLKWGHQGRYSIINVLWLISVGYLIFVTANVIFKPHTIPISVQVKEITSKIVEHNLSNPYELRIERGKFNLYLAEGTNKIPTAYYYNAILHILYIASFVFMAYQAKSFSYNINEKQFFQKSNTIHLKRIGQALAGIGILYPILQRKISALAIQEVSFSHVELAAQLQNEWVYYFAGILFVTVASAFKKGFELREENALTI